jgi:HKD family nuclease
MQATALFPNEFLRTLRRELSACSRFHVAMALVSSTGLDALLPDIERALKREASGEFLFGVDLPSHPDAIARLLTLSKRFDGRFALRRFASPQSRYFHTKLWVFDGRQTAAIVGSSNLTGGGLEQNYEANVLVRSPNAGAFATYFEELFHGAYARQVSRRWLTAYRGICASREANRKEAKRLRDEALEKDASDATARSIPKSIKGRTFVFTGGIPGWPRERVLYPYVRSLGGDYGLKASAIRNAAALVQGEAMGNEDTIKLRTARDLGAPILTQEEFFAIARTQESRSRRRSA